MRIDFYKVLDNPKKIVKNLGNILCTVQNVATWNSVSVQDPSFILDYRKSIIDSNYVYIDVWDKYYFISEPVAMPGGRLRVDCYHDVLMNNSSEILALPAYVARAGSSYRDKSVIDSNRPVKVIRDCNTIKFPSSPFSETGNFAYVLTVIGGKRSG